MLLLLLLLLLEAAVVADRTDAAYSVDVCVRDQTPFKPARPRWPLADDDDVFDKRNVRTPKKNETQNEKHNSNNALRWHRD
uniref:Putative secreted protein n=1 Tax=Anopheles darlingi TaxID=43151 RepID=A0A2M4DG15_ANODA